MRNSSVALVLAVLLPPMLAVADDWPRWLGPQGDGTARDVALLESWGDAGPKVAWEAPAGDGYAGLVVSNGRLFAFFRDADAEKDVLVAHDAATGRVLWRSEGKGEGFANSYVGTRATPWVEGERIYTYGGDGELLARDVKTGAVAWRAAVLEEAGSKENLGWGTSSSPLVTDGKVIVQAGLGGHVALAFDAGTGKLAWKSEETGKGGYAHVVVLETSLGPQLVVFGGSHVIGMERKSGKTLWKHEWGTSYDVNASSPITRGGRVFCSSGYGHGSVMLEVGRTGAQVVWESKSLQAKFPATVLDGDVVYGNSDGRLVAIDWKTGKLLWEGAGKPLRLGPGGSILRWKDRLILWSERGTLSIVKADAAGVTLVSQKEAVVDTDQAWSHPALANGLLYVKGGRKLVAFDLRAAPATPAPVPTTAPTTAPASSPVVPK